MTWSHAALVYRWPLGERRVIEAGAFGVHERAWEDLKDESVGWCLYELVNPLPDCSQREVVAYAWGNVGKPYNYGWLLKIAWRTLVKLRPHTYPAHVCSSLVYDAFNYAVDLLPGSPSVIVTPDELAASSLLQVAGCEGPQGG